MTDEFPRRRNLESLKKEAKRWLAALRAERRRRARASRACASRRPRKPNAARRAARARARTRISRVGRAQARARRRIRAASARTLEQYETMADALLEAYRTGTPEAMERHYRYTWHRRPWQGDADLRPARPRQASARSRTTTSTSRSTTRAISSRSSTDSRTGTRSQAFVAAMPAAGHADREARPHPIARRGPPVGSHRSLTRAIGNSVLRLLARTSSPHSTPRDR